MVPELLIFDCDGVLIDSEPIASRVLQEALLSAGVPISAEDVHTRFTGFAEADVRRICRDELGINDPDSVFHEAGARLYGEFARSLTLTPGIAELIGALPARKCVASNSGMDRLRKSLGLFDLWNAFAPDIFSADMVAKPKPAPDLFLLCASRLDAQPARCVVIDDSPHGISGAVAAGMTAIGFVDPSDPRKGRAAVLEAAGATRVATGAEQLSKILHRLFRQAGAADDEPRVLATV
ncbi:HAD family hydrolase [Mesorhizobium sp. RMAD-H1]|uniref:HAD family hydrolase n=1 Tax=Mesorhizobium sp. RMAD-H1 TaxID=2587065 RepID=UPI00162063F5|nr:HAD family hydrolase [Mesorhizobium sp. RMAD-H1]MBB2974370.1 HAD superfamily hydrolase (TIGR01509 family) [Mesorhizobium sp. RMAD-H1]